MSHVDHAEAGHQDAIRMLYMQSRRPHISLDWGPIPPPPSSRAREERRQGTPSAMAGLWRQIERIINGVFAEGGEDRTALFAAISEERVAQFQSLIDALRLIAATASPDAKSQRQFAEDLLVNQAHEFGGDPWSDAMTDGLRLAGRAIKVAKRLSDSGRGKEISDEAWGFFAAGQVLFAFFLLSFLLLRSERLKLGPVAMEFVREQLLEMSEMSFVAIRTGERDLAVDSRDDSPAETVAEDVALEQEAHAEAHRVLKLTGV